VFNSNYHANLYKTLFSSLTLFSGHQKSFQKSRSSNALTDNLAEC